MLAAHLCHSGVLWAEEDLPLAAALRMLHGSVLYRDIWFDKPPLVPAVYLLWGARIGPVLRVAGALYAFLRLRAGVCVRRGHCGRGAKAIGRRRCSAFFLTFDTHSAVLPLAADMLLLVPHLAAVLLASRKQAFWSGVAAGIGFLFNAKGVFVLAACAVFAWPGVDSRCSRVSWFRILRRSGWLVATGVARAVYRPGVAMAGAVCGEPGGGGSGVERRGANARTGWDFTPCW